MIDQNYMIRHQRNEARVSSLIFSAIRREISVYPSIEQSSIQRALESLFFLIATTEFDETWDIYVKAILGRVFTAEEKANWILALRNFLLAYSANRVAEIVLGIVAVMNKPEILAEQERTIKTRLALDEMKPRAYSIVRTETTKAMMISKLIVLQSTNLPWEKKWLANRDERTREAHLQAANGQFIPIGEMFIVGGENLLYPADTMNGASVGNTINCRCGMDFRIRR